MVDERALVIRRFCETLSRLGIDPDSAFSATFVPGEGWSFAQGPDETGSSSSSAGGAHAVPQAGVRPQSR